MLILPEISLIPIIVRSPNREAAGLLCGKRHLLRLLCTLFTLCLADLKLLLPISPDRQSFPIPVSFTIRDSGL